MTTLKVTVTYEYEIEVDDNNYIVQEYPSTESLVSDLVGYRFDILPVLDEGVRVKNVEILEHDFEEV